MADQLNRLPIEPASQNLTTKITKVTKLTEKPKENFVLFVSL